MMELAQMARSRSAKLAGAHYDRVTEGWRKYMMGDELHVGLFRSPGESLAQATENLTNTMIEDGDIHVGHRVLDVGCGTGALAIRLARRFNCLAVGISISAHQ